MCRIMIFGGTTEGRLLADYCIEHRIPAWISVTSDYGRELLPDSPWLRVACGAMDREAMGLFFREQGIRLCVDATHPYAREATENIRGACQGERIRLLRCLREEDESRTADNFSGVPGGAVAGALPEVCRVSNVEEAAAFLAAVPGNILVTTGSKELAAFTILPDFRERIFARVLPSSKVLLECERLGIRGRHLIAMQGPFSAAMNEAVIRETKAGWLVTKESGSAGGFSEKLEAAAACKIGVVVIQREPEKGISVEAACRELLAFAESEDGMQEGHGEERPGPLERAAGRRLSMSERKQARELILAGIGMGSAGQMTLEVREALRKSDAVCGARRMLRAVKEALAQEKEEGSVPLLFEAYLEQDVMELLCAHPEWKRVTVAYSGDAGFYSGAAGLAARLKRERIPFCILPGISSVSFLAARLGKSWEDAAIYTAHGRSLDVKALMEKGESRIFILMGGENAAGQLCRELSSAGYGRVRVTVGENLAYPEEAIRSGSAQEMEEQRFSSLSVVLLERE